MLVGVAVEGGGAEQVLQDLARGLAAAGHEVSVAFLEGTEQCVPSLEASGIRCARLLQRQEFAESVLADFTPGCILRFARIFRELRPDVIHSHVPRPTLWASMAKRLRGRSVPFVYTEHNVQDVYPSWAAPLYRIILPVVDHVVGVSEAVTQSFTHRWRWPVDRASTIWNGITCSRIQGAASSDDTRRALGVAAAKPLVLNVANLCLRKGHDVLVEAIATVSRHVPDVRCLVAGSPHLEPQTAASLTAAIERHSLQDNLRLLGARSDVPDLLAASDLFVLSSRQEGFPITILEAMAAGKPVVATDVGGCAEAVVHGETGLIVPPEDPAALANAILYLLQNPEQARRMGEAGRKRVEEHFTVDAMVRKHIELYERLIAEKRR